LPDACDESALDDEMSVDAFEPQAVMLSAINPASVALKMRVVVFIIIPP